MRPVSGFAILLSFLFLAAGPARASEETVTREAIVITTDADGDARERIIWFAELDEMLYIRTAPVSVWGRNLDRDGELVLRRDGSEQRYSAERVHDRERLPKIHRAFREKYGASDWWAGIMRALLGGRKTYRLAPVD